MSFNRGVISVWYFNIFILLRLYNSDTWKLFQEFPFLNREYISPKREFHSLKREFYSLIRKFHSVQSEFDFLQGEDFFNEITKLFSQKIKCTVKLDYKKATNNSTLAELGPAQLSLFPLNLTFDFDLIWGLFLTFWHPDGLFLASIWGSKTVLGSTHVVEQCSFFMIPWIVILEIDLILGSFLSFGALMGWFCGRRKVRQLFWGLLM